MSVGRSARESLKFITRHRRESMLMGLAIFFSFFVFSVTLAGRRGVFQSVQSQFSRLGLNHLLLFYHQDNHPRRLLQHLERFAKEHGIAFLPVLARSSVMHTTGLTQKGRVFFMDDHLLHALAPNLLEGRMPSGDDVGKNRIMLGSSTATKLGILHTPANIKVNDQWVDVIGIFDGFDQGGNGLNTHLSPADAAIWLWRFPRENPQFSLTMAMMSIPDSLTLQEVEQLLWQSLTAGKFSLEDVTIERPLTMAEISKKSTNLILSSGEILSATLFGLGLLFMATGYVLQIQLRLEEFGVYFSLGCSLRDLSLRIFMEVSMLTVTSGFLGIVFAFLHGMVLSSIYPFPLLFHGFDLIKSFFLALCVSTLTPVIPLLTIRKLDPIQLLRQHR
jgi:ABC-type lipoprotein release transport system permease subunit